MSADTKMVLVLKRDGETDLERGEWVVRGGGGGGGGVYHFGFGCDKNFITK